MKKLRYSSLKVGFVLFSLIFAIIFVSMFTYLPIYQESIENSEKDLREDLKYQSTILQKSLAGANSQKWDFRKLKKSKKVEEDIKNNWLKSPLQTSDETLFLTYLNPESKKVEIWLSNKNTKPHPLIEKLITVSVHQNSGSHSGFFSQQTDDNKIIMAAYDSIVPGRWGVVIQKQSDVITETVYNAVPYTLFAALLITFISWLIFRIKSRSYVEDEESVAELFIDILGKTHDWIWETDKAGNILYSSEQSQEVLGNSSANLIGVNISNLFHESIDNNKMPWKQKILLNEQIDNLELTFKHVNGSPVYVLMTAYPIRDVHNNVVRYRGIARNITQLKNRVQKAKAQTIYDPLTHLLNRHYFLKSLDTHFKECKAKNQFETCAVLYINLDEFKKLNDGKGHDAGDEILKIIAKRMQQICKESDLLSRFGGDEFVILARHHKQVSLREHVQHLEAFSKALIETINKPIEIQNTHVQVGVSIGIAVIPQDGKNVAEIISRADSAMLLAKSKSKNTYEFYAKHTQAEVDKRIKTTGELQEAFKDHSLELYYQPLFKNNEVVGLEALLRWRHPETRKVMPAGEFMSAIKDNYQAKLLDEWVINHVAIDMANLNKKIDRNIPVSINLSTQEMFEKNLPEIISQALQTHNIPFNSFGIETSENILAENFSESSKTVKALRKLGVKTTIDHFGTGYLSLANLQLLPIEAIKIDKTFIDNIATNPASLKMCRTIINFAQFMQLQVIAEGVETPIQKDILHKEGCDIMQGYTFAYPMPFDKLISYLNDNKSLHE